MNVRRRAPARSNLRGRIAARRGDQNPAAGEDVFAERLDLSPLAATSGKNVPRWNFVQKKWLKNIVFVIQQADLREASEIDLIQRHLQDTAMQKLAFTPPIFPVSARKALLARTKIPFSHTIEFLFWVSYMVPSLPTTIAWITLLDPDIGMINVGLKNLFGLEQGPFFRKRVR